MYLCDLPPPPPVKKPLQFANMKIACFLSLSDFPLKIVEINAFCFCCSYFWKVMVNYNFVACYEIIQVLISNNITFCIFLRHMKGHH